MPRTNKSTSGRTILYYPTIAIPTAGSWIRSALLYWDNIASIVPRSYDDMQDQNADARYEPEIQRLYEEGVFSPVNPDLLVRDHYPQARKFEDEVLAHARRLRRRLGRAKFACTEPIFRQKISDMLFSQLEKLALAKLPKAPIGEEHFLFYFHPTMAAIYMAILADYLAAAHSALTIPATDDQAAFDIAFGPERADKNLTIGAKLFEILPQPRADVSLAKILAFRQKYRAELLSLREQIDGFEASLQEAEEPRVLEAAAIKAKEKIERECLNVARALRGAHVDTFLGSLHAFINSPSPYLISAGTVLAGKAAEIAKVPVSYGVAGAAVAGSIAVTLQYLKRRRERNTTLKESAFAYIFLAEKKFA
jgi:hypothetical protein